MEVSSLGYIPSSPDTSVMPVLVIAEVATIPNGSAEPRSTGACAIVASGNALTTSGSIVLI